MSMFDVVAPAADTVEIQGGGRGFFDDMSMALTAGATGAVISGLGSIYNTAAAGVNALGGDVQTINTENALRDIDDSWGNYYKQNQNAVDVAGFIGTSLIPGTLGIKALNMARAGSGAGAVGRALGFTQTMQARSLSKALGEMATEGGTVFAQINKNKLATMAWGAADQTLQAAAFETAVALTMKQSPMLADDSWWDIGKSAFMGAAFGGVIGGAIDGLILNKSFKNAVSAIDTKTRNYDYVANLDKLGLDTGDKAFAIVDSLLRLPSEVLPEDKMLDLAFHVGRPDKVTGWNPLTKKISVNVETILGNTLKGTEKNALQDFEKTIRTLSTDSGVTTPFAEKILKDLGDLRSQGLDATEIRDRMGDWLFELKGVRAATTEVKHQPGDLFYFKKQLTPDELGSINTVEDLAGAVQSTTPFDKNAYKNPYVFLGTAEQRQQAFKNAAFIGDTTDGTNRFRTLGDAWKAGHDVAIQADGTIRVNDASTLWRRVEDPVYKAERFLNTRTGAFTEDTVLTAADRAAPNSTLQVMPNAVKIPDAKGVNKIVHMGQAVAEGADVEYYTARHAWASQLDETSIPRTVDVTDFSLMDRLRTVQDPDTLAMIVVKSGDNTLGTADQISIQDTIRSAKMSEAQRIFSEAYEAGKTVDVRAVAYQLNVDAQWLENAVAVRFRENLAGTSQSGTKLVNMEEGLSLPLSDYLRRENVVAEFARPQQFRELDLITPEMSFRDKVKLIQESVAANGGQFVTGEQAWAYRIQGAVRANKNAAAAVLGAERFAQMLDLQQDAAKLATSLGSGASTFGASNADYGDMLRLFAQDQGKKTHLWVQQEVSAAVDKLAPVATKLRTNRAAAAEVGIVTNMLRSTDEKYVWELPRFVAPSGGVVPQATDMRMMLRELQGLEGEKLQQQIDSIKLEGRKPFIEIQDPDTYNFLRTHSDMNAERVQRRGVLINAKGLTTNFDPQVVYVPPIDTTYFQHFAFVRPVEGKAFGTSEVTMVFGRDAAELQKRISLIDKQNFDVITKKGTEDWFKAKDLYDFDKTINEPRINAELRRSGALSNVYPEVRAETVAEDYIRWHQNQAGRLVRDAVETNYAQQFAEIRGLGETYTEIATSKFAGTSRKSATEVANPYDDYIKTALDVSKRSEYQFLHQANEFVDALGTRAYRALQSAFSQGEKGLIPWQEVNSIAEKHGIKGVYSNSEEYFLSNVPRDRNLIKEGVTKANMLLANTVLRLDFFNSVVNTVSTPIMLGTELASIRSALRNEPELLGKLEQALSVSVPSSVGPGKGYAVPSTTKLIAKATENFFGDKGKELLTRYKANGDIKDTLSQFHSMIDDLALRADFKVFSDGVTRAFEKGARITMNEQAEQFTRFISADVMRQLTEDAVKAGTISLKEQNAYISVFTNRVQGNYISSQRPIVFQGVLGSAVSLFQTYSFNLMQQLTRHVANKDKRAVATMFGLQAGLFGLNGTPFFEAVNTHLIGNSAINQGHYDAYSVAPALLGKEMGDWLMYGTTSAMPIIMNGKMPALYTRGDINPRHASILPLNPLDIPAIDAGTRVVGNIVDMGSKLLGGGAIVPTLLQGLEHNGINRPLAGFAQVLQGQATTSKGSLISASSDFDLVANSARMLGARPMDEAVALNNLYRVQAYRAADKDRMSALGEKVKTYLYKNQMPPDEVMDDFMKDYAKAGGRLENFQGSLQHWAKDSNISTVEKIRNKMKSSYGQRLSEIMGGEPLQDWSNTTIPADPAINEPPTQ
jgi:hypothetical protein